MSRGHLVDQVCRLRDGDNTWLITSEWERLECFIEWEESESHRELAAPLRACVQSARSLKFDVVAETVNPHPERNRPMDRAHVNGVELEYELAGIRSSPSCSSTAGCSPTRTRRWCGSRR